MKPTYNGHSIGHWEGDTLVVDTIGLNGKIWLDRVGHPESDQMHIVERIHRVDEKRCRSTSHLTTPKVTKALDGPDAIPAPPRLGHPGTRLRG